MEQKDIDIYEILKGVHYGTKLYTPICGNVEFTSVVADKEKAEVIWTEDKNGEYSFDKNGKWMKNGEVMLFPSKKMRDWSKFAWKKGDVLVNRDKDAHIIFEEFTNDTYTEFTGKHYCLKNSKIGYHCTRVFNTITEHFDLETEDAAQTYINDLEKRLGGKLNRETLKIEKPEFKEGDIVIRNSGSIVIVKEISYSSRRVYFHAYTTRGDVQIKGAESWCYGDIKGLKRLATDSEKQQLFDALKKKGKAWDAEKKQIVDLPKKCEFQPFEKVLVRYSVNQTWCIDFFERMVSDCRDDYYKCMTSTWRFFIPYEGNEHLLGTTNNVED